MDIKIKDKVELIDITNLDSGLAKGTIGFCNAAFEDLEGNRFIMFHPEGTLDFYWTAAWRFRVVEE